MKFSTKTFLFPAANIIVAVLLSAVFFVAGQNVAQTFRVAGIAALNNLQPQPLGYFLDLNTRQANPDKNKIHCYVDYYEHLLQAFPNLWDAYGMLGYCYHYLNDDRKAIWFLKTAVEKNPGYFWNYYNLAAIYANESRYEEASRMFQKAVTVSPVASLKKMFTSQMVYMPLLESDEKKSFAYAAEHIKQTYRSTFVLIEILNHVGDSQEALTLANKLKMELYAF